MPNYHQPLRIIVTMKFSLAFLIALALSGLVGINASPVKSSSELHDVLDEFMALVPKDKIVEIFLEYLDKDPEVQKAIEYMESEEFQKLVKTVESIDDVINFYDYLNESGLDIYKLVNKLHKFIGLPPLVPRLYSTNVKITGGISGLYKDIEAILPIDDIKALYEEKLKTSPAFAELVKRFSSPRFQELINQLRANEEFREIVAFFQDAGIDINAIKKLLTAMFGLEFPEIKSLRTADLNDDLRDFLALLPVDKITEIAENYLDNDPQVQEAVVYLQSPAFRQIVQEVEAMKEAREVLAFLQESGLDAYGFLNKIHELLGIPAFKPSYLAKRRVSRASGGLPGLIADIKAILPLDDIKALYEHKLVNSPAFANLIKRLSSPEFQEFVDAVLAKEEAIVIINKLKSHGVDLQAIADLLTTILGLKFPKPNVRAVGTDLNDDLQDFLALLPVDKITEIAENYLDNDPQVQEAVVYLQSPAFRQIVQEVEAMKEAREVLAFLQESGLDAYGFLNKIHELLGIPAFKPSYLAKRRVSRASGGLPGLIADIKAILPLDDIKALYEHKLVNSPAFANLIKRLSSPEFQEFVDAVLAKEEAIVIINKLKSHGVDLQAIADLLTTILGLKFPKPNARVVGTDLNDDLQDFLALLPVDKITEIAENYLDNDPQVQEAVVYLQSPAFHQIVQEVEAMKEAREVLAFLQESGLDAYGFLNKIHELLGIPAFKPSYLAKRRVSRASGGLPGLIADIKAILPLDDIKALYEHKLVNSPAFANLIKRLSSPEFQEFVDAVLAKEEAIVIINKLKSHGVDLQAIADLLTTILGLKFPKPNARAVGTDLNDDLQDFLALLPVDKITEIAENYLDNDPQVQEAVVYLQSPAFRQIVQEVEAMKEARLVLAFLQESGLDAYGFLNKIHELLGIPAFKPSYLAKRRISGASGGLPGLIADIKAILPLDDIKALYENKLVNSPAFANLIKRLSSQEFQEFVDAVLAKEEAIVIINKLKSHGVDLQAIADLLTTILGLKFPKPTLLARASNNVVEDLIDFLDILPLDDIIDVAVEYVYNDPDVQKAAAYIKSEQFKVLATNAQQNNEFRTFVSYIEGSGLPAFKYINMLNHYLAIAEVGPPTLLRGSLSSDNGVRRMLDAIESLLPRDDIKKMSEHKMKTSEAFIYFIQRLKAPEFQTIVDRLVGNKDFQKLGYRAAEFGIDIKAITEFMSRVFGIEMSNELLP